MPFLRPTYAISPGDRVDEVESPTRGKAGRVMNLKRAVDLLEQLHTLHGDADTWRALGAVRAALRQLDEMRARFPEPEPDD